MARKLEKGIRFLETGLVLIAAVMLLLMMFLGTWDVVSRYAFNAPVKGAMEIGQLLMGGAVFLTWAYTLSKGDHVTVDIFFILYPPRLRATFSFIMMLLALILFVLIFWQATEVAISNWQSGKLVQIILIPVAPFKLMVSLGALVMSLECIVQMCHQGVKMIQGGKK